MIRRLYAIAVLGAVMAAAGCTGGPCSTGFYAGFNKPPTLNNPIVVGPQVTSYGMQGLASTPLAGFHSLGVPADQSFAEQAPMPLRMPAAPLAAQAARKSCTLDDVCNMLQSMQSQLTKMSAQRMPGGEQD